MSPAPAPPRPGTSWHAPGVRLSYLAEALQTAGEKGTELPGDILGDIVRVEVTLMNTGVSQYSLTLNNAHLTTARDRSDLRQSPGGGTHSRAERMIGDQPAWPRFKYNNFDHFTFGRRLRIDLRYAEGAGSGNNDDRGWVPMIAGPITDVRFSFASGQGSEITVSGEDDLSALKDKNRGRFSLGRASELDHVRGVLRRAEFPLAIAPPASDYPAFITRGEHGTQDALHDGQGYLEYIQGVADRLDFEVFVEFEDLANPESPQRFHFEPWRSRVSPLGPQRETYLLHRERTLLEFSPTIKVVDQYSEVTVRGRHRDPLLAHEVRGVATTEIIRNELHYDASIDGRLASGPEARERFFRNRQPNKYTVPNQSNLDQERADWYACTAIRKKAREFFTIEGATVGMPRLRPGRHVEIRGMRPPFDGFYYLTKTVHTLGADGYRTRFSASRPGMELPDAQHQYREEPRTEARR